ncbi:MAG: hypothetical protein JWN40_3229 [Phycisphaerales bacterium]|nr:hypothetical protein [Phycisphaerales bacterium]
MTKSESCIRHFFLILISGFWFLVSPSSPKRQHDRPATGPRPRAAIIHGDDPIRGARVEQDIRVALLMHLNDVKNQARRPTGRPPLGEMPRRLKILSSLSRSDILFCGRTGGQTLRLSLTPSRRPEIQPIIGKPCARRRARRDLTAETAQQAGSTAVAIVAGAHANVRSAVTVVSRRPPPRSRTTRNDRVVKIVSSPTVGTR